MWAEVGDLTLLGLFVIVLCVFTVLDFVEVGVPSVSSFFFIYIWMLRTREFITYKLGSTGWKESLHYHMEDKSTDNLEHSQSSVI